MLRLALASKMSAGGRGSCTKVLVSKPAIPSSNEANLAGWVSHEGELETKTFHTPGCMLETGNLRCRHSVSV